MCAHTLNTVQVAYMTNRPKNHIKPASRMTDRLTDRLTNYPSREVLLRCICIVLYVTISTSLSTKSLHLIAERYKNDR